MTIRFNNGDYISVRLLEDGSYRVLKKFGPMRSISKRPLNEREFSLIKETILAEIAEEVNDMLDDISPAKEEL